MRLCQAHFSNLVSGENSSIPLFRAVMNIHIWCLKFYVEYVKTAALWTCLVTKVWIATLEGLNKMPKISIKFAKPLIYNILTKELMYFWKEFR